MTAFGIDLTGSLGRAVVVDDSGRTLRSSTFNRTELLPALRRAIAAGSGGPPPITGGVAVDPLESPDGRPDVSRMPSVGPVQIVHPGAAAITAEHWCGAAQGMRHAICLWVADTVQAGLLLDGKVWPGAHGAAGAAAWLALNPVERQDYRRFGSLAAEVSHAGLARRFVWRLEAGDTSTVLERAGGLEAITAAHVFAGAGDGDAVATSVVRDTARYIGMAAANFAAIVDPELIVIGGLPSSAGDLLIASVLKEAGRRLPPALFARFRCELSPLGEDGIAIGAARLASMAAT